jgi:hypothetical protein
MRSLLIRCYPARWRERYGDEFLGILEERPLGPYDVADILLGALDARLRLRGRRAVEHHGRGFTISLRIGGIAAILGTVIWTIFFFLVSPGTAFQGAVAIVAFAGLLALLVAVTGLSAYQARSHPRLVWSAFAITAAGTIALFIGAAAELSPVGNGGWNEALVVVGGFAAVLGSALFGIATYRASAPMRGAASLLVAGAAIGVAGVILAYANLGLGWLLMFSGLICFLGGWLALGLQAIRLDRPTAEPRPA